MCEACEPRAVTADKTASARDSQSVVLTDSKGEGGGDTLDYGFTDTQPCNLLYFYYTSFVFKM